MSASGRGPQDFGDEKKRKKPNVHSYILVVRSISRAAAVPAQANADVGLGDQAEAAHQIVAKRDGDRTSRQVWRAGEIRDQGCSRTYLRASGWSYWLRQRVRVAVFVSCVIVWNRARMGSSLRLSDA